MQEIPPREGVLTTISLKVELIPTAGHCTLVLGGPIHRFSSYGTLTHMQVTQCVISWSMFYLKM